MSILTIAREYGSGGKDIGRKVAERMGYDYVDRGRILEDMRKIGTQWEELAKYFDENKPDVWERFKWSFRGYVALIQSHILHYALQDNMVIMGRGGNFLLKGIPHVLRIRTTASIEKRIEKVMQWQETNSENAEWLIKRADKEMAGAVYLVYGFAWDDRAQYDLLFDTGLQSYDEIVDVIAKELQARESLKTDKAVKLLALKALAAKINADLAIDNTLHISSLDVKLKEEGLVEYGLIVSGAVHTNSDIPRIKDIVGRVAGSTPIEYDLRFRWQSRMGPPQFK
ncbi:MAG TPA: cytidylate kinase-like family protein [Syntrophorhabdaceae bacterium]|nr:cytidylate kinase-like family protein [Syntrophorhabdaceae bacterium]HQM80447.1 cytidylate kinase-like family protein [Syntrophorhabdaceae bacterium]